ncbi:MAG: MFS transporter [Pyrinomonadaceae bacterium]|nr:MFS transporter [Phycisphaerales bacterium]
MRTPAATTALKILAHPFTSFHPRRMPLLARRNYRSELVATTFFSMALGMVEGSAMGVVVKNAFDGIADERRLNYVVGIIIAAPDFANLTSFLWAAWSHGKPKVRFVNALQLMVLLLVGLVAVVPRTSNGLLMLAACMVAARVSISGIVTLRATVWRANYPTSDRARVTGKLAILQSTIVASTGIIIGSLMDWSVDSFRVIFPCAAVLGMTGIYAYSHVRVRRERSILRAEVAGKRHERPSINPISIYTTLRADRNYAWFMLWMFIFGSGNLMFPPILVITLREQFHLGYLGGIVIMQSLPYVIMPMFIPLWARLLDSVHVVKFRTIHSWVFVAAQGMILIAAFAHAIPLMYFASVLLGIAYAGGTLAWNLGHLDFAPPHQASQYMGVHVTLNGVRGLLAPLLAVTLFELLGTRGMSPESASASVFAVSVALCITGAIGFVWLSHSMGAGKNVDLGKKRPAQRVKHK